MRAPVMRVLVVGSLEAELAAALRDACVSIETIEPGSLLAMHREVRRRRPQLIHAREGHLGAALVGKATSIPVALEVRANQVSSSAARAARLATRTVCGGPATRDALLSLGAPPARTALLRGLLDPAAPHRVAPFGRLEASRFIACSAPVDEPDRGVSDLVLAFLSVARSRPSARLVLAGPGAGARALAEAESAGLRGRVAWVTARPEQLPRLFADATAVVGPARKPAYCDAILEAMMAGAATIATAVGPHPSWVREGRTGFLVPPQAPVPLAARLAQVLDDAPLATRLGDHARQLAADACAPRARAAELTRCWSSVTRPLASVRFPLLQAARTA